MSKFLHRDGIREPGAPSAGAFDAAERLGIVWPALPWTCPGCRRVFEDHKDTVATVDLALATAMVEIRNTAPSVLSSPRTASMPMFRRALEAFVEFLRADAATHGPPAVFLCMACDFGSSMGSIVVHVLDGSRSLCEMHGVPGEWPANHKWVRRSDAKDATCFICKALLTREEGT